MDLAALAGWPRGGRLDFGQDRSDLVQVRRIQAGLQRFPKFVAAASPAGEPAAHQAKSQHLPTGDLNFTIYTCID